jgi:hypothetical protein
VDNAIDALAFVDTHPLERVHVKVDEHLAEENFQKIT